MEIGESRLGYPSRRAVEWAMKFVAGYFTRQHVVWKDVTKSKPSAKIPGGGIKLSAADGLGRSLEVQNKPGATYITLHWVSKIKL